VAAYLAPSLRQGRADVDARWPNRVRKSDGWIGDAKHRAGKSDHNPASSGVVRATDTTVEGIDPNEYVAACCRHPATRYVIYNRVIRHRSDNFAPRRYTGDNPHTSHIHRSIDATSAAEQDTTPLDLGVPLKAGPLPAFYRTLSYRAGRVMHGDDVRAWQQRMRDRGWKIGVDGEFGAESDRVCRKFQAEKKLQVDGEVGPNTWKASWMAPVT
jgi:hypothetical protein